MTNGYSIPGLGVLAFQLDDSPAVATGGSLALVGELRCGEINILFVHTLQLAEGWLMVNVEENFRFPVVLVASSLPHRPDRRMARWKIF